MQLENGIYQYIQKYYDKCQIHYSTAQNLINIDLRLILLQWHKCNAWQALVFFINKKSLKRMKKSDLINEKTLSRVACKLAIRLGAYGPAPISFNALLG